MKMCGVGRSSKPSGFTLVELAVVLLLLTVVLGLVLPETASLLLRSDLKASSRRLAGSVAHARSQAMLEGRLWELVLDLEAGKFWTSAAGGTDLPGDDKLTKRSLVGQVRFLDVHKGSDEAMTVGRIALRFHPRGLAEPAVIHLAGPGDRIQTLRIKPFNGRLTVYDGYVKGEG